MGKGNGTHRVMAECEACESAYAARQWSDGTVQPIGSNRCRCGSTDFRVVDEEVTGDPLS